MGLLSLEHSKPVYWADFALHGSAAAVLAAALLATTPAHQGWAMAAWVPAGVVLWTLLEYLLHRFVLHGLRPFSNWHAQHHDRPTALICGPTVLSASLIALLVFAPLWWLASARVAEAGTLGVLLGYLAYGLVHHATHHWHGAHPWLRQRKRWHALHHHRPESACFGVSTGVWDRAFGTHHVQQTGRQTPQAPPLQQAQDQP